MSLLIYHVEDTTGSASLRVGNSLELTPAASKHVQVLRKQPMDTLRLFDGRGNIAHATIQQVSRKAVNVLIDEVEHHTKVDGDITLLVGLIANDRMDWLVEKATELGATCIQPVVMQRSTVRLPVLCKDEEHARSAKKRRHWQQIAINACEQSGRPWLPSIEPIRSFSEGVQHVTSISGKAKYLLSLEANTPSLPQLLQQNPTASIAFCSGCEGGLEESEQSLLLGRGFTACSLGAHVLRAETAPLVALSMHHAIGA